MQELQILLSGVAQGCIYGLVALGFVLIYKATETVSFAQGELMMVGAFAGLGCITFLGLPFALAVLVSVLAMAALGWLTERVVINPVLGEPSFSIVMLTFGLGYLARGLINMIPDIGTDTHKLPVPYADANFHLGALVLGATQVVVMAVTLRSIHHESSSKHQNSESDVSLKFYPVPKAYVQLQWIHNQGEYKDITGNTSMLAAGYAFTPRLSLYAAYLNFAATGSSNDSHTTLLVGNYRF
jgi:hypothetical protein